MGIGSLSRQALPASEHLVGRLYFRIGAVYAIHENNHKKAVAWYDKAVPLLKKDVPISPVSDPRRRGDALVDQAITKRCENIDLYIPPDHPFAEFVQRFGAEWKITYPRYGSGMMRVLNQQPLFEKIASELEQRLAITPLAGYTGVFDLRTDLGTTTLAFDAGKLTVNVAQASTFIKLPQDKLMQLVVGYRSVRDLINAPDVQVEGEILPLLNALFPKTYAYPWVADHF
jgi:hypothetical protein